MHWGNFKIIYLFLLLIILLIVSLLKNQKTKKIFTKFKYLKKMDNARLSFLKIKNILFFLSLIFLIIALMKPQWGVKEREVNIKGADIIFAVDVSNSMLAKDLLPSRLERAKKALSKFVETFSGNFVSLIAFAGESKVIVPLTFDYDYIKYSILSLSPVSVDIQGTNFKDLLEKTVLIFKKLNRTRFLIILTDGEDNEGNIKKALAMAKESNIKIYTIGVGTLRGERIPEYDSAGKFIGFKKDKNGNFVFTRINPEILRNLSEQTGGKFFLNTDLYKALKDSYAYIRKNKGKSSAKISIVQYKEKYFYFAFIAFLLLFLSFSLPAGKNKKTFNIIIILFLSFFINGFSLIDRGNYHNNKGIKKYHKKRYKDALKNFRKAKDYTFYDKKLDFNIADALYKSGKYEEALKYYLNATKTNNERLKKSAYFNMGNVYYKTKRYKDALNSYKSALKLDPSFKKAKQNLELTLKKLKKQKQKKNKQNNKNKQDKQKNKNQNNNNEQKQQNKKEQKNKQQNINKKMEKKLLENLLNNLKKKESKRRKKQKKGKRGKSYEKDW